MRSYIFNSTLVLCFVISLYGRGSALDAEQVRADVRNMAGDARNKIAENCHDAADKVSDEASKRHLEELAKKPFQGVFGMIKDMANAASSSLSHSIGSESDHDAYKSAKEFVVDSASKVTDTARKAEHYLEGIHPSRRASEVIQDVSDAAGAKTEEVKERVTSTGEDIATASRNVISNLQEAKAGFHPMRRASEVANEISDAIKEKATEASNFACRHKQAGEETLNQIHESAKGTADDIATRGSNVVAETGQKLKDAGSEVENKARSLGQQAHETYDAMKARAEHGRNAAHEKTAEIIQKAREYAGDAN